MPERDNGSVTLTETQASGGTKPGRVRYMLLAGLVLVIAGFLGAYLLS